MFLLDSHETSKIEDNDSVEINFLDLKVEIFGWMS